MMLRDAGKVLIEVALNEAASKATNPRVPYTPDEVVEDAIACGRAGAALVHLHARGADGSQAWADADSYRRTFEAIGAESDVVCYPSYADDYSHVWDLVEHPPPGAPLLLGPFDVFAEVGDVLWDEEAGRFTQYSGERSPGQRDGSNLGEICRRGLRPVVSFFDVGDVRWAMLAVRAQLLDSPFLGHFFLNARIVKGPSPAPEGIDAYLTQVPDRVDMEPILVPYMIRDAGTVELLIQSALDRGMNVRVGIGDCPEAFPRSSNADCVARAADMLAARGLVPATPQDLRHRLNLPPAQP